MTRQGKEIFLALAALLLSSFASQPVFCANDVDIAPNKNWCKLVGGTEGYALNPDGACVKCDEYPSDGVWQLTYSVCPSYVSWPRPYAVIKQGEYKYCVCAAGYWGKPKGFPKGELSSAKTFIDVGCYCCDPGRASLVLPPANITSPFQCNVCNPKLSSGTAPFCVQKPCPAGAKRFCPDCRCVCKYDPYNSDEGRAEPPCPFPPTQQCTTLGLTWGYRANKCICDDYVYRPDSGCKCSSVDTNYEKPMSAKRETFKEPTKGGYCSYCEAEEEEVVIENGKPVCACKAGYVLTTLQRYFGGMPYCRTCNGPNVTLDSNGDCACKKGLAPFFSGEDDDGGRRGDYMDIAELCRPCTGIGYKVNTAGVCVCADGYALRGGRACVPCSGPGYKIELAGPTDRNTPEGLPACRCDIGYFSQEISKGKYVCSQCPSGATTPGLQQNWIATNSSQWCFCKDPLRDLFNKCACKFGYQEDGKGGCVKKPSCSNTLSASFWSAAQLPSTWKGGAFPAAQLTAKPASQLTLKLPFNATSLATWTAAGVPASIITAKFAAQLKGCVCRPPTPLKELAPYDPISTESEVFVVVERADASMTANPPLKDPYLLGDTYPKEVGLKLRTPVLSVTGGSTGSKHVGVIKAVYIYEVCLQYDIKFWADAPQSKGPMLSVYVYTPNLWKSF